MAEATEVQVKTMIQNVVRVYDQLRLAGNVNTGTNAAGYPIYNLDANQATFRASSIGTYGDAVLSAIASTRSKFSDSLSSIRGALTPLLTAYAVALNLPLTGGTSAIFSRLFKDAIDNGKRITSRGFQFGAISAGASNHGNGTIYRLNLDENGLVIENQHADTKVATCITDASASGSNGRNEEVFELRGATAGPDIVVLAGSGDTVSMGAISARTSVLQNSSFSQVGGTAAVPTSIPGWTSSITVNATNFQYDTDTNTPPTQASAIYRDYPGDTTPYALRVLSTTSWTLKQSLEVNRATLVAGAPYFLQIAYKKSSIGADGTLSMTIGASIGGGSSASVNLSTIADTNWHTLVLGPSQANWFKNFDGANLTLTIGRSGQTTGQLSVDDILFQTFSQADSSWYAFVGGTTQFLRNDTFAWTDTELPPSLAILQNWIWRALGLYFPACPPTPTAPTVALAGAGAGNVDNGSHVYATTFVDANGVESGISATNAVTVADKTTNGKVSVSAIQVGPTGTASRWVYRSKAGTTTPLYRLATIAGNVTTTYADNIADASLSVTTAPSEAVTWLDPA